MDAPHTTDTPEQRLPHVEASELDCQTFTDALQLSLKLTGAGYELRLNRIGTQWIAEFGKTKGSGTTPTTAIVNAAKLVLNPRIRIQP